MKKELFLWILILSGSVYGQVRIEYNTNPVFGLLQFTEHIGERGSSRQFNRKVFNESRFAKDTALLKMLSDFTQLDLGSEIEYAGYPKNRGRYSDAWTILVMLAADAASLKELESRSCGLFPAVTQKKIMDLLRKLEPVYHELVLDKYSAITEEQIQKIRAIAAAKNIDIYFGRLNTFYGSSWNKEVPFRVLFYPVPGKNGFSATPKGNVISCGLLTEEKDLESVMGVIFHEMAHILYAEQPPELQHKLEKWFDEQNTMAALSYLLLNEATATASGNGYIVERLKEKLDSADWYYDYYINKQGKGMYELTKQYIDSGRTIDSNYVNAVKQTYAKLFSTTFANYDNLFTYVSLVMFGTENNATDFYSQLCGSYYIRTPGYQLNEIDNQFCEELNNGIRTRLVVVTQDNAKNIAYVKTKIKALRSKQLLPKGNYLYSFFDEGGMPYVFINVSDVKKLDTIIPLLAKQKSIGKKPMLVEF